jgi:hypothetical protein
VWLLHERAYYLLHMERGIYEYPQLRKVFTELVQKYDPYQIQIEEAATSIALKNDRALERHFLIKLQPIEQDRKGRIYMQQAML